MSTRNYNAGNQWRRPGTTPAGTPVITGNPGVANGIGSPIVGNPYEGMEPFDPTGGNKESVTYDGQPGIDKWGGPKPVPVNGGSGSSSGGSSAGSGNGSAGSEGGSAGKGSGTGGTGSGTNGSTGVFTQADADAIKAQGNADVNASNAMYDGMIANNESLKNETLNMIEANKNSQMEIANENTEFTIDQIEQQKAQAKKDYTRERSGAYVDWQKASSRHGVNAEQMAANGLTNTGYSESSQVAMYNQYQNRIAVAREAYGQAITDYNNAITSARLQNNATLAEIAANALEQRVQAIITFVQQGNELLMAKADSEYKIKQTAHSNYMDVMKQIEAARQYDESKAFSEEKWEYEKEQDEKQWEYKKEQDAKAEEEKDEAEAKAEAEENKGKVPEGNGKEALFSLGAEGERAYNHLVKWGYGEALDWIWTREQWEKDRSGGTGVPFMSYREYVLAVIKWIIGNQEE